MPHPSDQTERGVSVVIPAYNAAATLRNCLEALSPASPDSAFEIVLVDDASTDDTVAIATTFGCKVIKLRENSGPAVARNAGVETARFDTLLFVDTDVVVPPGGVAKLASVLKDNPDVAAVVARQSPVCPFPNLASRYKNYWTAFNWMQMKRPSVLNTSCAAVRREVFQELGGFDTSIHDAFYEDDDLGMRMTAKGFRIAIARDVAVAHWKYFTVASLLKRDTNTSFAAHVVQKKAVAKSVSGLTYSSVSRSFLLSYPLIAGAVVSMATMPVVGFMVVPAAALFSAVLLLNTPFWAFVLRQEKSPLGLLQVQALFFLHVFCIGNAQLIGFAKGLHARFRSGSATDPIPAVRT